MSQEDHDTSRLDVAKLFHESDLIYRIGGPKKTISEKLQLLILKLIILLWEEEDNNDIEKMKEKLKLIDDIRHELAFLRAKYYKVIFSKGSGLDF